MHFGRCLDPGGIDFRLPPDPLRTERFLALSPAAVTQMHVGCPVWAEKAWVGSLYPPGTKPAAFLRLYGEQFASVELNSTFYQLLPPTRIRSWAEAVPVGFKFSPKVYRGLSEGLAAPGLPAMLHTYCTSVAAFGDKLGLPFMQLPESFGPAQAAILQRFLQLWPQELPLAIEFRHPGWFSAQSLIDPVINLLYRRKVATVITDTPGRRDVLHLSLTQPQVMIRFQGTNTPASDTARLAAWANRLRQWENRHLTAVYLYAHQPEPAQIPATASAFLALWREAAH